jgi:hypothetical protein
MIVLLTPPLEFPRATNIGTCFAMVCFTSAANAALETAMETIRSVTSTPDEKTYAYTLIDAAIRTHQRKASGGAARLTYIRRFKAKKILTGEERVAERLVYSMCFDSISSKNGGNVVHGLLSALEDKRLELSITTLINTSISPFQDGQA